MLNSSDCTTGPHSIFLDKTPTVNSVHSETFLLSIVIPTFSRQNELAMLLDQLCTEIVGLENEIEILVSENCSTDQTALMLADFTATLGGTISFRWFSQPSNLGAIRNLHFLVNQARAKYIWALGDDDALVSGGLFQILEILRSENINLLLVRAEGIGEWESIPERSAEKSNDQLMRVSLSDENSADYLFAGGFLGSVIIDAKKWGRIVPEVDALHETCYSNWAAVLRVASDDAEFYVIDTPYVKGNFNMRGASTIPAFQILVLGRIRVWATLVGTPLHKILIKKIAKLASSGWVQVSLGNVRDVATLRKKLVALNATYSLLGSLGIKSYFFALVSILFPFPRILDRARSIVKKL